MARHVGGRPVRLQSQISDPSSAGRVRLTTDRYDYVRQVTAIITPQLRRRFLFSLLFGLLVITGLAFFADAPRVLEAARHFTWAYVPAILALTTFNYLLRGVKWQYYLRLIGVSVGRGDSAAIFASGLSMAMTPGKLGELLKAWLLRNRTGTPVAVSAPIIMAERLTDGVALLILASGGLLLYRRGWQVLLLIALVAIVVVAIVQSRALSLRILAALEGVPALGKRAHNLRQFYESAYVLLRPRPLLTALALGVVSWSGECFAFFLVLVGLGFAATPELFIRAAFVLATSTLVGSASLLPGGLGAAEASSAALLRLVLPISGPTAVVATLLIRFCTLWFGVAVGVVALLFFGKHLGLRAEKPLATAGRKAPIAPRA
jgi:uncharacterized protein (TIRG00374 family)